MHSCKSSLAVEELDPELFSKIWLPEDLAAHLEKEDGMGQDPCCHLLSKKGRNFPIAQFKEYQKGYKQLYLQGSPWLWEQNCQETIILLPQFATQW